MINLFKARKENSTEWIEGVPYNNYMICGMNLLYGDDEVPMSEFPEFDYVKIDPNTIRPFIGKKDKNGNKIFEGDIVKTKFGRKCVVIWNSSSCFLRMGLRSY